MPTNPVQPIYAANLHGVQIGLVNWADNNPSGLKILPIANAHFD